MSDRARPRREISQRELKWLMALLRYSATRDAYVLKGAGRHLGPVYRLAPPPRVVAGSTDPGGGLDRRRD